MYIKEKIKVPTGDIFLAEDNNKWVEFLSIGDYGKSKNIKADFLGYTKEINGVEHQDTLPLTEKWVITISTQHGCSMKCKFCDVPKVPFKGNVSFSNLISQVIMAMDSHPEVKHGRINLHYARMGEPTFNPNVLWSAYFLAGFLSKRGFEFHPVVSTMMPKNNPNLENFIRDWMLFKENFLGNAGLQLSINTTDEKKRNYQFSNNCLSLEEISDLMDRVYFRNKVVPGRKITLNFALSDNPIDAKLLRKLFNPEIYLCKITPMHKTLSSRENNLKTEDGYNFFYPYKEVEDNLKKEGFDVIVFIPSEEEEKSLITCGNLVLKNRRFYG